jgi:hypothetical protein
MKNTRNITNLFSKHSLLLVLVFASQISFAQTNQTKATNLGIVSELVYIKLNSENLAIRILNDSTIDEEVKLSFLNKYTMLKTVSDQILLQLIADLKRRNKIKFYKKLDNVFTKNSIATATSNDVNHKKLKSYIDNFRKIDQNFQVVELSGANIVNQGKQSSFKSFLPSAASVEELTGVLSFVTATIKDVRESREKKVEKICVILNDLRLKAVQDLLKKEEKKEEKK